MNTNKDCEICKKEIACSLYGKFLDGMDCGDYQEPCDCLIGMKFHDFINKSDGIKSEDLAYRFNFCPECGKKLD